MIEIKTDISAITRKEPEPLVTVADTAVSSEESQKTARVRIAGLRVGKDIYLPPNNFLSTAKNYFHEVGHVLGDEYSFQAGLMPGEEGDVLSIDEAKVTRIDLTPEEVSHIRKYLFTGQEIVLDEIMIAVINRILTTFAKGNPIEKMFNVHFPTQAELEKMAYECDIITSEKNEQGQLVAINSKTGRNTELSAYLVQFCCLQILENTLKHYYLMANGSRLRIETTFSPAHQRAQNIIAMAFRGERWRVPSMVDISSVYAGV